MRKIRMPSVDEVFLRIKKYIDEQDVMCFKVALLLCFVGYFPFLTSWLGNPDSFRNGMIYKNGSDWENRQGDFGLTPIYKVKAYFISPVLSTVCALIMLALVCVLLRKCFEITKKWQIFILICIIAFSPNVCGTLTYYHCSDSYMLAHLLSVAACYLLVKYQFALSWIGAVCLMVLSLSCNQTYVSTVITLLLMVLIYQLLSKRVLSDVLKNGLRWLSAVAASIMLYVLTFHVLQHLMGFEADRQPFALMPKQIIGLAKNTYLYCLGYFFTNDFLYNDWYGRKWCNLIAVICLVILLLLYLLKDFNAFKTLAIMGCFSLLPPALMILTIIAPAPELLNMVSMKMPAMNYVYFLPILAYNAYSSVSKSELGDRIAEWVLACVSLRIVVMLIVFVTAFEGYMQLNLNRMMTAAVDIERQIDTITAENELELENMKVMFAGELPNVSYHNMLIDAIGGTMAEFKMAWNNDEGRQRSWSGFMRHSVGKSYETVESEKYQEIIEKEEFQSMPVFPVEGYAKKIEDTVVIKLG